jgi:cytochrome c-type biogenesis protein CcmH/NrfG
MDNVDTQKHITKQDVEKMVSGLAAKLAQCPNDLKGWAMLARP